MFELWYELKDIGEVHQLEGRVFTSDSGAVKIGFIADETLSGSVTANVIKPDGTTAEVEGDKSGNKAWAVIPQITQKGKIGIFVKLTNGNNVATLGGVEAYVY